MKGRPELQQQYYYFNNHHITIAKQIPSEFRPLFPKGQCHNREKAVNVDVIVLVKMAGVSQTNDQLQLLFLGGRNGKYNREKKT